MKNRETRMNNYEKERKKQWEMMKKRGKNNETWWKIKQNEKWWKLESQQWKMMEKVIVFSLLFFIGICVSLFFIIFHCFFLQFFIMVHCCFSIFHHSSLLFRFFHHILFFSMFHHVSLFVFPLFFHHFSLFFPYF